MREAGHSRVKKIGVMLDGLVPQAEIHVQADLFAPRPSMRKRHEAVSQAIDRLNRRFGRDTVLVGMTASQEKSATGTKIAFTRIPDMEEFLE
jgi:DNA polymerase-4